MKKWLTIGLGVLIVVRRQEGEKGMGGWYQRGFHRRLGQELVKTLDGSFTAKSHVVV